MFSSTGILTSTRIIWFFMEWWDFMCVLPNFYPRQWICIHNTIFYPHEWIFIHKNEFLSTCAIYVYWLAARHDNNFVIYEGINYICILPNFYPHEAIFYPQTLIFIHTNEFYLLVRSLIYRYAYKHANYWVFHGMIRFHVCVTEFLST